MTHRENDAPWKSKMAFLITGHIFPVDPRVYKKRQVALESYLSEDGLVVPIALPIIQSCIRAIIEYKIYVFVIES